MATRITTLTADIASTTTVVTNASTKQEKAQDLLDTENSNYATYVTTMLANNEQIDFELGVLDRAEFVLHQEGISRS